MPRALVALFVLLGLPAGLAGTAHAAVVAHAAVATSLPPIAPPLPRGVQSKSWSVPDYIAAWEKQHGRPMTAEERYHLARGCIGVTVVNLDREDAPNPPLNLSFGTYQRAMEVQAALNEIVATRPSPREYAEQVRKHPALQGVQNLVRAFPTFIDPANLHAAIFSKRFYSKQDPNWTDEQAAEMYRPNPRTGQVDMSTYRYRARPGYVNFDYGWYDEQTNNWWHANHAEPGMKVYQSTLRYYSRPLLDFDEQVFTVAFARVA
ncbi:hypothetical protein GCM10012275_03430 [Longimycelium tulufanense]|uniref:Microbial transglutaminase n=1 Tax=Longimycelium tulufanense TaxID=907463 RepID=A0A8J3FUJ0_9PSEU|nr:hypothetical protein GCM10012275_03430 [Longimycelium tulufanense]